MGRMGFGSKEAGGHAVISFLLGAALPTALLFFLASDRLGEGLSSISTSWRGSVSPAGDGANESVFVRIRHELVSKLGVKIEPLETVYFGGFCEYHVDPVKACTMHADCCIGLENKVHDLGDVAADWKNYTSLAPEERKKGGFRWTYPTRCRKSSHWRKP